MKNTAQKLFVVLIALAIFSSPIGLSAAEIRKHDATTSLWNPFDWFGGSAPTNTDTAVWDNAIAMNSYFFTDTNLDWAGIEIRDPQPNPINLQINTSFFPPTTLTLGGSGIDMSEASADLMIGGSPDGHITTASAQTWHVAAGRTLTMSCTNDGPGAVTKAGSGTLRLNYDWPLNGSHLSDTAPLTLAGGVIEINGGNHVERVGATVVAPGATRIQRMTGSSMLELNSITRQVGGTMDFLPMSGLTQTSANNDTSSGGGILGGWAIAGGDWAQVASGGGNQDIVPFPNSGYSADFFDTNNVNLTATYSLPATGGAAINSLRFDSMAFGARLTIGQFGPCSLTNLSGGVLCVAPNVTIASFGTNGSLRGPLGRDLVFHVFGFATNQIVIADNGGSGLTKTGPGLLVLNPPVSLNNAFTGPTRVNEGTLKSGTGNSRRFVSSELHIGDGFNMLPGLPRAAFVHGPGNNHLNGTRIVVNGGFLDMDKKQDACDTLVLSNNATLTGYAAGGHLTVTNSATNAVLATSGLVDAVLNDWGGLTKTKFGTLKFLRNSWVYGPTRILDGRIQVGSNATLTATALILGDTNRAGKLVLGETNNWMDYPAYAVVTNVTVATSNIPMSVSAIVGGVSGNTMGWNEPALIFNTLADTSFDVSVLGGPLPNENNLGLTKTGPGTLTLTGFGNYNGFTSNTVGVLKIASTNAMPRGTPLLPRGSLALSAGASLELDSADTWLGGLFGAGVVTSSTNWPVTLNLHGTGESVFAGNINNGAGQVSVNQRGTGRQVFLGTNTFTGTTRIEYPGSIGLGAGAVVGNGTSTINLYGGSLVLTEDRTRLIENPITVNGWGFIGTSVSYGIARVEFTGLITAGSSETLVITNMSQGFGDGSFFGVVLSRPQTFNMPISIQDSTYPFVGSTGLYTANTTGTTQTFNGPIYGPGAFVCASDGVTILNATNRVFPTFVNGGLVILNGAIDPYMSYDQGYMYVQGSGVLAGNGRVAVPLTVTHGGTLSPGKSIGKLTINNTLTFATYGTQSTCFMELEKNGSALTNDSVVGITTLTYAGTLMLTNLGPTALAAGDSFKLFSATNYVGAFTNLVPATPGPGFVWDTSGLRTNGTLRIAAAAASPAMNQTMLVGTNFIIRGSGGTANGTYYVLASTNAALPLTNWTALATNTFDAGGNFSFTNPASIAVPQKFFLLQLRQATK